MSASGQLICRLADEAASARLPADALATMKALRSALEQFEREEVARALSAGESFADVARALGISRQAAHRRFRDLAPRPGPAGVSPTGEARMVIKYARAEADRLSAPALRSQHVVLGVLRAHDAAAAAALRRLGVDLRLARGAASALGRLERAGDHDGPEIRSLLTAAMREAASRQDPFMRTEHILLGALSDRDGGAAVMLGRLGVTAPAVRAALAELAGAPSASSRRA
jgi:transposase-like protein